MIFIKQNENVKFSIYPTFLLPYREKFLVTVTCFTFTFHFLPNLLLFIMFVVLCRLSSSLSLHLILRLCFLKLCWI
jgi:hypothetical protein